MTQENKSAADVAAREISRLVKTYAEAGVLYVGSKEIELLIEQAILSETATLRKVIEMVESENAELRAINNKQRKDNKAKITHDKA